MQTLRSVLIRGATLSIILAACSPAMPISTAAPISPTAVLQSTAPTTTPAPTAEPVGPGIPVIETSSDGLSRLLVISSVTGKGLDAFSPIPLGHNYSYSFAPDGHTLALVSDGQLYFIDLPSWKYRTIDTRIHGWLSAVVYSSDGTLLALASGDPDATLSIVDVASGEIKAGTQAGFAVRNIKFTADGKSLMVFGPQLANTGVAANIGVSVGAPKAVLFALSDLSPLWSVELSGVRDGTFPKKTDSPITQDIYQPGAAWHYEPGVTFDPDREMLYVVHGDEDKLTTVDFSHRKVHTMEIHDQMSWLEQFLSLTAGVVHAKGMDGTIKHAVISPNGQFLYVVGSTETITPRANGNVDFTQTFLGLQIIATTDGSLINKNDTEANSSQLSPDSRQIFSSGWKKNISYETPWTDVYDISSNSLVKHLDNVYLMSTRRMDGKPVLVSSYAVSDNLCYMASLNSIDTILGEWTGSTCFGWLIAQ